VSSCVFGSLSGPLADIFGSLLGYISGYVSSCVFSSLPGPLTDILGSLLDIFQDMFLVVFSVVYHDRWRIYSVVY